LKKKLTLGIDIGITSVGWGIIDEDFNIIASGVRLFNEANKSLNEGRRTNRIRRRVIRRRKLRLLELRQLLIREGIISNNFKPLNKPYHIRAKGLKEKLNNEELATALLHIIKRRGVSYEVEETSGNTKGEKLGAKEAVNQNQVRLKELGYVSLVQLERLEKGEKVRGDKNVFKTSDYVKEITRIMDVSECSDQIKEKVLELLTRQRHFSAGPGGFNSPTPYGSHRIPEDEILDDIYEIIEKKYGDLYLQKAFDIEYKGITYHVHKNGTIINKKPYNLIELMRGRCSLYPKEFRAPKKSPSAEKFNLINDLVNIKIVTENNRQLTTEEIKLTIEFLEKNFRFKPKGVKGLLKFLSLEENEITGLRINENKKPIITEFETLEKINKSLTKEEFKKVFNYELLDEIIAILTASKIIEERIEQINELIDNIEISTKLANITGISEYHSLSLKAIYEINVEMIENVINQQQVITKRTENTKEKVKKLVFDNTAILSPVAKRAHRQALRVVEELMNEFGEFDSIVVETTRSKNSDHEKKIIADIQEENAKQRQKASEIIEQVYNDDRRISRTLIEKVRYYEQQNGKCAYTNNSIDLKTLIKDPYAYEIDHIIPFSISRDNSQNNKVLVTHSANQKKDNKTPFLYFMSGNIAKGKINSYDEFKAIVLSNKNYSARKKQNLLFEEDINKFDVQQEFVARNLVDTAYAARTFQRTLKSFFDSNNIKTKVYAVRGKNTAEIRSLANYRWRKENKDLENQTPPLVKNRTELKHHAVDAIIVAGLSRQENFNALPFIMSEDKDLQEIIKAKIDYDVRKDPKVKKLIKQLNNLQENKIRFSWKIDSKPNRELSNQTISSTRVYEGEHHVVNTVDNIYEMTKENIKKLFVDNKEKMLMYQHDIKTYNLIIKAYKQYKHEEKPLQAFKDNHGPIRKYSKKGNGPIINKVKYLGNKLGNSLDITHKYITNNKKVVMLNPPVYRVDIYLSNKLYKPLFIEYNDVKKINGKYQITKQRYEQLMKKNQIDKNDEFQFSIFRNTIIRGFNKRNPNFAEFYRFISVRHQATNRLEVKRISQTHTDRPEIRITGNIIKLEKYNVSVTGIYQKVEKESLQLII